jgi:hypothetical protein
MLATDEHSFWFVWFSLALPDNSPVKDLLAQNQSSTRTKGAGKHPQRRTVYSSHTQNGSAKKSISGTSKDKIIGSPELEQISTKRAWRSNNHLGNGVPPEFHSASTSSAAAHRECKVDPLEARYAKLSICPDDADSSILLHSDGDALSPEKAMSEDFQTEETTQAQSPEVVQDDPQGVEPLLVELTDDILGRLPMLEALQLRPELGKAFKNAIHRPAFRRNRPDAEGEFSPSYFMTDDEGDLHWHGFDTKLRKWTRLPSLNFAKFTALPSPDPDLFKDYLVAGDRGLLCMNVGKATGREKLVICNPLTQQVKVLPRLNFPRHPVLMHLKVGDDGHYKVFVAGSAAIGSTEELSLKTEEYDSRKGVWECPDGSDLPCPPFGLNEYQNGAYYKDIIRELLMCVAIVDTRGRGVLMYDIKKKTWVQGFQVKQLHIPLIRSEPNDLVSTQVIECDGSVLVFSEQESGWDVYFLIHKLMPDSSGEFTWDEVMRRKKTSSTTGSLEYPEFTCVPVSEHELCMFNTLEHTIGIIDLNNPTEVTPFREAPAPILKGNRFHSLNPISFVFKPSFTCVTCPRGRGFKTRCDLKGREYCSECERRDSDSSMTTGLPLNVRSKVINSRALLEEAGFQAATAPPAGTDTTTNLVESGESEDKRTEEARQICEDIRGFLDQF